MKPTDYATRAQALFLRFAARHDLSYSVVQDAPIEVLWTFPEQLKLSMPITLGLQNLDELNFGVADFWSYFFPFEQVEEDFERTLDLWVSGNARIAIGRAWGRYLQVREGDDWKTIYGANGCLLPFPFKALRFLTNEPVRRDL